MATEMEQRQLETEKIEVRAATDGQKKTIGGYAVKYNSPTLIQDRWGDEFLEEVSSGAFDKSLQNRNQKALWNHDVSRPLGSVSASTLRFNSDMSGLNYDIDLPNNTYGNDAYESVMRGDVDGSSFGFKCISDIWSKIQYEGREVYKRSIVEADLFEVSPCTFPAYDSSEMSCRSLETFKEDIKKEELRKKLIIESLF